MFSKSVKLKSDNMTKLGERKKLKTSASSEWARFAESNLISSDIIDCLFPLKEPMFTKKFQGGDKQLLTVYASSHNPIAFDFDGSVIPSLQSLWRLKLDRPIFVVGAPVIDILARGADLMAPGVLNWETICSFDRGDIFLICAHNSIVPVAICSLLMNFTEAQSCGFKGKLATILHIVGDELFKLGKLAVPSDEEYLAAKLKTDLKFENCDHVETSENGAEKDGEEVGNFSSETGEITEVVAQEFDAVAETTKTMEDVLEICLFSAVKLCKNNFPIICSTFQSQYMIPSCPSGYTIDVKKSRYKKMSVFYKEYESRGLIKLSVSDKDVMSIVSADLSHQMLRGFKISKTNDEAENDTLDSAQDDSNENFVDTFVFPEITSLLIVTKPFSNVFVEHQKGATLTSNEVRTIVKEYVLKNCESDSRGVLLDPHLASLLLKKNESLTHLTWQDLNQRSLDSLQIAYQIVGGSFIKPVVVKGKSNPIVKVTTHKRAGNKYITVILNLEKFGINMKTFARFLQNLAACSSSVTSVASESCVQVQGNQVKLLRKLFLEQLKFPPKFVDIPIK